MNWQRIADAKPNECEKVLVIQHWHDPEWWDGAKYVGGYWCNENWHRNVKAVPADRWCRVALPGSASRGDVGGGEGKP